MRSSKSWLFISILTLLLALCWAGVTAVSKMREKTIPADLEKIMVPLDSKLNMDLFTRLQERQP